MTGNLSADSGVKSEANQFYPPRWAESLLTRLLKPRDRESIPGDLLEEYREERLPAGRTRANLWYVGQTASIIFIQPLEGGPMKRVLMGLCFFTLAAAAWLGIMETILHHPGFILRIFWAAVFAGQSLATVLFLIFRGQKPFRILLGLGGGVIVVAGASAVMAVLRAAHFEGYVLIIGAALLLQGALTIAAMALSPDARVHSQS